jgi:hypothetical protein
LEQVEVVLFAFDRAFGTGAGIAVSLPEGTISGDEGVEAIVFLGIGIDNSAVSGAGTAVIKEGTGVQVSGFLGSSQRAAPFEAEAVGTEAPAGHRSVGRTDGDAVLEA